MVRFAFLVLLAACNGNGNNDDSDTGPVEDADGDGFTIAEGDCNDNDAAINPGATETYYDGIDQNCDDLSDDDADGDGEDAEAEGGDDCDDTNAAINPDAEEQYYDGVDADCDGESDFDADLDGFDSDQHGGNDCDDTLDTVNPDADEVCSTAYDDDCDDATNEQDAVDALTWYLDFDEDLRGNPDETTTACTQPDGYVANDDDCNDEDNSVFGAGDAGPAHADVACDGFDNDCDPLTFEASAFLVNDVAGTGALATAVGNAIDNDVITLCEGKHVTSNLVIGQAVTLEGLGGPTLTILEPPTMDVDPTTAVLTFGAPLLKVNAAATDLVVIRNLSLTKSAGWPEGNDLYGGGLYVNDDATVTLTDVIISGNRSGSGSGIFAGTGSDLTLTRVNVEDNLGYDSLGNPYAIGGGFYLEDDVTITAEDLLVDGNYATLGGGFYANEGVDIVATGASFVTNNDADLNGGGLRLQDGCTVTGPGLTIGGNSAISGGGIYANENATTADIITITDVTFLNNFGSIDGGGLAALGVVDLVRVVMDGNGARYGGNLHLSGGATYLTIDGGSVRNGLLTGSLHDGGGAFVSDATIESIAVDWGVGADDNAREDIWLEAGAGGGGVACSYGSSATFVINDEASVTCP